KSRHQAIPPRAASFRAVMPDDELHHTRAGDAAHQQAFRPHPYVGWNLAELKQSRTPPGLAVPVEKMKLACVRSIGADEQHEIAPDVLHVANAAAERQRNQ